MLSFDQPRKIKNPFHFETEQDEQAKKIRLASEIPDEDLVTSLRNLCIRKNYPLPTFELVQQSGTIINPEYTYQCNVSCITRVGVGHTKKISKQLAAQAVYEICEALETLKLTEANDEDLQVTSFDSAVEDQEEENFRRFKTYRELTESDVKSTYVGKKFADRYKYFKNFFDELKQEAIKILQSKTYISQQDQVLDLLRALKLKHKVSTINMLNMTTYVVFEVVCDIDVVFINRKEAIWAEILQYFQVML